ncbi:MAG: PAS domain-containing protein, partial [candidate division Zixibacteria bacterium]|nr:PAS domain-containing protein [candidate division Zixibacteria bacterium]
MSIQGHSQKGRENRITDLLLVKADMKDRIPQINIIELFERSSLAFCLIKEIDEESPHKYVIAHANSRIAEYFKLERIASIGTPLDHALKPECCNKIVELISRARKSLKTVSEDIRLHVEDNRFKWLSIEIIHISDYFCLICRDISRHKHESDQLQQAQEDLSTQVESSRQKLDQTQKSLDEKTRESREYDRSLQESRHDLETFLNCLQESAYLIDLEGRILMANQTFARRMGLKLDDLLYQNIYEILDEPVSRKRKHYADRAVMTKKPQSFEDVRDELTIYNRIYPAFDADGQVVRLAVLGFDITQNKKAEKQLIKMTEELARSNRDLEQFAYIASHDLQEPLRMVSSFTQLLARRYAGRLDKDADEFIAFAVDGARRMSDLIQALLRYSRVHTNERAFEEVDLNRVLNIVTRNLKYSIEESGAKIKSADLPIVTADETQMIQLMQNLLSNAIKFRSDNPLEISIGCESSEE